MGAGFSVKASLEEGGCALNRASAIKKIISEGGTPPLIKE
jgi:hypothetical protein